MDRSASTRLLVASVNVLSRKIFASLPFGIRLAAIYQKLATSIGDLFGRTVYAIALYHGVKGLPDIKGAPASNYGPKGGESLKTFVDKFTLRPVEREYGAKFGRQIFATLKKNAGETQAEDILLDLMGELLNPSSKISSYFKTESISQIEQVLYRSAKNSFQDELRKQKHRKTDPFKVDDEGAEIEIPDSAADVGKMDLTKADENALLDFIEKEGPRIGRPDLDTYFELLRDGFDSNDIYRWHLLPSMQKNLPEELRIDPHSPYPFNTKSEEMAFREKVEAFPNPFGTLVNFNRGYIVPLRQVIQDYVKKGMG